MNQAFEALFTTSVAAAILASLDRTRALMAARGEELVGEAVRLAGWVRDELRSVEGLRILDADDPTKVVLVLAGTGADGFAVEQELDAAG